MNKHSSDVIIRYINYISYTMVLGLLITIFMGGNFSEKEVYAQSTTASSQRHIQESFDSDELEFLYDHYHWTLDKEYMLLDFIEHWQISMGQSYEYVSFQNPMDFMGLSVTEYVLENARMRGGGVNLYFRDMVYHHNSPNQHFQIFSIYLSDDPHLYFFGKGTEELIEPTVMYAKTELNERGHVIFEPTQNADLANAFRYLYYGDYNSYQNLLSAYQ